MILKRNSSLTQTLDQMLLNHAVKWKSLSRPIYIGKNQNPKNLGFLLYRLHCQKNP